MKGNLLAADLREPLLSMGLLVLRIGTGLLLLLLHAAVKLDNLPALTELIRLRLWAAGAPALAWTVALVELIGSILLIVGLGTRLIILPLLLTLLLALTVVHFSDPWHYLHEVILLFLVSLMTLLCTGPGRFSLDAQLTQKRKPARKELAPGELPPAS